MAAASPGQSQRLGDQRPDWPAGEILRRVGERMRRGPVEPVGAVDLDGVLEVTGLAHVAKPERGGALARQQDRSAAGRVEQVERSLGAGLDR